MRCVVGGFVPWLFLSVALLVRLLVVAVSLGGRAPLFPLGPAGLLLLLSRLSRLLLGGLLGVGVLWRCGVVPWVGWFLFRLPSCVRGGLVSPFFFLVGGLCAAFFLIISDRFLEDAIALNRSYALTDSI